MIENTFIKKITAGILRNRKMTIVERNIMHPERDWLLGIFAGFVIVTVVGVWSVNTYIQFKNISVTTSAESPDTIIYKKHLVDSALVDFSKRKETYESLKNDLIAKKQAVNNPVAQEDEIELIEVESIVENGTTSVDFVIEPVPIEEVVSEEIKME